MLLNNFIRVVGQRIVQNPTYPTLTTISGETYSCTSGGGSFDMNNMYSTNTLPSATPAYNTAAFALGTDDSKTTQDMYCLVNELSDYSGFSVVSHSRTMSASGKVTYAQTLEYSGNSDITIKEVGYIQGVSFSSSNKSWCMFTREVISPITIKSGDTFTISMTIG